MSSAPNLLVTPQQLYAVATRIKVSQSNIRRALENLGNEVEHISGISFLGVQADQLLQNYRQQKAAMANWTATLEHFAHLLVAAADAFIQADQTDQSGGPFPLGPLQDRGPDDEDALILAGLFHGWKKVGEADVGLLGLVSIYGNDRTLAPFAGADLESLKKWWHSLSATEQQIEEALAWQGEFGQAEFKHVSENNYAFVMGWIQTNQADIKTISAQYGVDPSLVAGILASEMFYDYGWYDAGEDNIVRDMLQSPTIPKLGVSMLDVLVTRSGSFGYANGHSETLQLAYKYLDGIYGSTNNPANGIPIDGSLTSAAFLVTDKGAITAAALAGRYYTDAYCNPVTGGQAHDPARLTANDMAIIWSAYRAGVKDVPPGGGGFESRAMYQTWLATHPNTPNGYTNGWYPDANQPQLGPNASLALPIMQYMQSQFANP